MMGRLGGGELLLILVVGVLPALWVARDARRTETPFWGLWTWFALQSPILGPLVYLLHRGKPGIARTGPG